MRVVFVGAGNLATRLSLEMRKSGMSIGQVYSHTSEHAKILADELGCGWTVILKRLWKMPTCMFLFERCRAPRCYRPCKTE